MSKNPAPAAQPAEKAAVKIQAVIRGHNARKLQKAEKAAVKNQAVIRSHNARKLQKAEKAAVKIQALGRGYIARNILKAKKAEKAEVFRPAATAFLTNITQQAVAQYANRTQVSHRTPTILTKATSTKTAHGIFKLANHISVPVVQGGSATDFPPLSRQKQNKAARRRGHQ